MKFYIWKFSKIFWAWNNSAPTGRIFIKFYILEFSKIFWLWNNSAPTGRIFMKFYIWEFSKIFWAWNNSAPTGRIFMKFYVWEFSKIFWENLSFIKNLTRMRVTWGVLYMKTNVYPWPRLAESLEWEIFLTKILNEIKTDFHEIWYLRIFENLLGKFKFH